LPRAGQSRDQILVGARFFMPLQTGPGPHPASYVMGTVSFPGIKWLECGIDHPHPLSTEVRERVGLYIYCPCGPWCPVLG